MNKYLDTTKRFQQLLSRNRSHKGALGGVPIGRAPQGTNTAGNEFPYQSELVSNLNWDSPIIDQHV